MKKRFLTTALGAVIIASQSQAQINTPNAFNVPEGYSTISANISGNGQHAIVGIEKGGTVKYLSFKKTNGKFGNGSEQNPLNDLIAQNVTPLNPSQSNDGSKIYFAADNGGNTDIFYIALHNGKWSEKIALGDSINTAENEQYPAISPDGNTIYFTRLKPGAEDSRCGTIYLSTHNTDGSWSKAKDVPEPITLGCDAAPYVGPDSKTIYFSSIREGGKGGFDVYYTYRPDAKSWMIPLSIDTINSTGNDMTPTFDYDDKQIYLYTKDSKKTESLCKANIPDKFLPSLVTRYSGVTTDKYTGKPLGTDIEIKDAFSSIVLAKFNSDDITGEYDFFLNVNTPLFIDFSKPNYSHTIIETTPDNATHNNNYQFFDKVNLQLNVFDSNIFEALSSDIEIDVDNEKQNININEFDEGRYKMVLPIGNVYNLAITKDLYSDYLFDFDLSQVVLFEDFEKDAELESMKTLLKINVEGLEKNETAEVTIINLSTDSKFSTTINTDFNGKAEAWLRKGDIYQINIIKPGYTMYNQTTALGDEELAFEKIRKRTELKTIKNADFKQNKNITFDKKEHNEYEEEATALTDEENNHKRTKDFKITTFQITADETINKDGSVSINAVIQKLEEGVKMEIENINFATNSSALNSSSYNSLEMLVKTLKMNPDIRVEISAHTDNIGSKAYNMKLSDQRAASVASYLFNQGIARDRIISKGYGADMPIADNNTEEGRSKNRRVELKILGNN